MRRSLFCLSALLAFRASAQAPDNLVVEGVPPITDALKAEAGPYLESRTAAFNDWHPTRREILITTRFADSSQLHGVKTPGGARRQLTFLPEPVSGGQFQPKAAKFIVFSQDTGGGEFFQFYRYDPGDARITLLTDGKSRNTGARWAKSGKALAYTSTRRNGTDNDVYVMDPAAPKTDRLVHQVTGGGWSVEDWSPDETRLLLLEYISINEGYVHELDLRSDKLELLTPKAAKDKCAIGSARYARNGKAIYLTTEVRGAVAGRKQGEFQVLAKLDLATREQTFLTTHLPWNVDEFELSSDDRTIAFVTNEDGIGVLRLLNTRTGKELARPKLPLGIVSRLDWHENGRDLAFNLNSAKSPLDVYVLDTKTAKVERCN